MSKIVSWIHFGDLHIRDSGEQNYQDFLQLIDEANAHMASSIAFALLPGDNADDGEEDEYRLVQAAVNRCRFPVHAIAGDHDEAGGSLHHFLTFLGPDPNRSFTAARYRFLLLNSLAERVPPAFGLGAAQMAWLRGELSNATRAGEPVIMFMHAYPSEHGRDAGELRKLVESSGVILVEMGHTHYNELANDGRTVYAATRSTGQIEEGPAGFSVTTLDDGAVSWMFKPMGEWPLVMITSPCDQRLIVDPSSPTQVVRGPVQIRARVWGGGIKKVTMRFDEGGASLMSAVDQFTWHGTWDPGNTYDGSHSITVTAETCDGRTAIDRILVSVNRQGKYLAPVRHAVDYENALGEWSDKHILGTQLGPNENGHPWPACRERRELA